MSFAYDVEQSFVSSLESQSWTEMNHCKKEWIMLSDIGAFKKSDKLSLVPLTLLGS